MSDSDSRLAARIGRECLALRLRRLDRVVSRRYDEALRPLGLRHTQLSLLAVIAARGPLRPADLAQALEIEKSTLSRNLARLAERGLVSIAPGEDGRSQDLTLTDEGRSALREASSAWRQAQQAIEAALGADAPTRLDAMIDSLSGG